ncbi:MAG: acyltransferase [Desulfobacteraceae bacterium]|nr:acyltransferase [Desulfobacteraceae bacterium]
MRLSKLLTIVKRELLKIVYFGNALSYARRIGVKVGSNCRLIKVEFGSEPYLITLGDRVSASHTKFVTHDGGVWVMRDQYPEADIIAPITVGNNVFFGVKTIILPGVTIGDNVVVGAGSVVTKDIPSGTVVAGVPAKRICSIDEYIESKKSKILHTKGFDKAKKREYLMKRFTNLSPL